MNPAEIKELIDEVKVSGESPLERAKLLASLIQAYHLAIIGEQLTRHNAILQGRH